MKSYKETKRFDLEVWITNASYIAVNAENITEAKRIALAQFDKRLGENFKRMEIHEVKQ